MEKLQIDQILVHGAKLEATKHNETDPAVSKIINETKRKQAAVLKLKDINQDKLRAVVRL